ARDERVAHHAVLDAERGGIDVEAEARGRAREELDQVLGLGCGRKRHFAVLPVALLLLDLPVALAGGLRLARIVRVLRGRGQRRSEQEEEARRSHAMSAARAVRDSPASCNSARYAG